jgi:type IV pilus assembly protein PilE
MHGFVVRPRSTDKGFTLIELMVAVAIVGILVAVALPSYTAYISKGRRADARSQLTQAAQYMQRFYSANDQFHQDRVGTNVADVMPANLKRAPADGTQIYSLSVNATAGAFTLTMAPVAGQSMASDACGSFTLGSTGVKGVTGSETVANCWK